MLFYPISLTADAIERIIADIVTPVGLDTIDFPNPGGGTATHAFALPYRAGMDSVEVSDATLVFASVSRPTDITAFSASAFSSTASPGAVLTLNAPARLYAVELGCANPPDLTDAGVHLLMFPMANGAPGTPLYAYPALHLGSGLFSSTIPQLSVTKRADGYRVAFPRVTQGKSWLFALLTGSDPSSLTPAGPTLSVRNVTIDAAPADLKITLATSKGEVALWSHPGSLYPDAGAQQVGFVPIAAKQLQAELATAGPTLPLTLTFASSSAGTLSLNDAASRLQARYTAKPLSSDPTTLRLSGSWETLAWNAPLVRPNAVRGTLRVKSVSQEINAATPVADDDFAGDGVLVDVTRWAAVSCVPLPRSGDIAGSMIALEGVRLPLAADVDCEVSVEIHADVAGLPGPIAGAPMVMSLKKGVRAMTFFSLKTSVSVVSSGAALWVLARCTKGSVRWHAANVEYKRLPTVRVSDDRARTWRELDPVLGATVFLPHAQVVQSAPNAEQVLISMRLRGPNGGVMPPLTQTLRAGDLAGQFPATLLDAIGSATASAEQRAVTEVELSSNAVADVVLSGLVFTYDV